MNDTPLITVVIPVYNRASRVTATLVSLAAQEYRPLKVILVDNNSTDNSLNVLRRWSEKWSAPDFSVKVISCTTPGACAARNAGLALVDTEWTMFFDSDDIMYPTHIATAMATAAANPDADIVGWDVSLTEPNGRKSVQRFAAANTFFDTVLLGNTATQRYMARTDLFRRAGGWREGIRIWDDIELGVRLLRLKPLTVKAKGINVEIVQEASGITGPSYSSRAAHLDETLDIMSDNLPDGEKFLAELRRAILAGDYAVEGGKDIADDAFRKALDRTDGRWHRLLLRIAYRWRAAGLRGAARLLRPFV